jgi:hypothetical protein
LWNLDLNSIGLPFGVYIIWHGGQQPKCIYVGSGVIVAELAGRRVDPSVSEYLIHGLYVTWAEVPIHQQQGVVTYLSKHYNPLVASQIQDYIPLPVNLPPLEDL